KLPKGSTVDRGRIGIRLTKRNSELPAMPRAPFGSSKRARGHCSSPIWQYIKQRGVFGEALARLPGGCHFRWLKPRLSPSRIVPVASIAAPRFCLTRSASPSWLAHKSQERLRIFFALGSFRFRNMAPYLFTAA